MKNKISNIRLFLCHFTALVIYSFFFDIILKKISVDKTSQTSTLTLFRFIIITVVGPIIETLIFQTLLKYILEKIKIKNYYISLFILTAVFGFSHPRSSPLIAILFTISCIPLNNYYLQIQKRESTLSATWRTMIFHSMTNLFILLTAYIKYSLRH